MFTKECVNYFIVSWGMQLFNSSADCSSFRPHPDSCQHRNCPVLSHTILKFLTFKPKFLPGVACPRASTEGGTPAAAAEQPSRPRRAGHHQAPQPGTRSWSWDMSTRTILEPPCILLPCPTRSCFGQGPAAGIQHLQKALFIPRNEVSPRSEDSTGVRMEDEMGVSLAQKWSGGDRHVPLPILFFLLSSAVTR